MLTELCVKSAKWFIHHESFGFAYNRPPQCNTLIEGFEQQLPGLVLGTLIIAAIARVVIVLVAIARNGGRRQRDSVQLDRSGTVAS